MLTHSTLDQLRTLRLDGMSASRCFGGSIFAKAAAFRSSK
jgi:hypothetical protein